MKCSFEMKNNPSYSLYSKTWSGLHPRCPWICPKKTLRLSYF